LVLVALEMKEITGDKRLNRIYRIKTTGYTG
jgi:hypothetical protein